MFDRIYSNVAGNMGTDRIRRLHFVGIGGVGMSGIAEVFSNMGFEVSGSDITESATVKYLRNAGIQVDLGHDAANISDVDVVVTSSAVHDDNVEVLAAKERRIPVVPRAAMLAELMRFRFGIAVAGTHGKTTTTSLVTACLAQGGLDPTYVIGGRLNSSGSNARLGEGRYLVAEADESDASFLFLQPMLAVVTNIDADHMSTYKGDFTQLRKTFLEFLHHLPFYGLVVICVDDPVAKELLSEVERPVITYGHDKTADIRAFNVKQTGVRTSFSVAKADNEHWLDVTLNLPGEHNVQNALAAIAVAHELGVDEKSIQEALSSFAGIGRRFQVYGELTINNANVLLVDDYAHHPREIEATLSGIRSGWPKRRIVLLFQPHRYSRTRDLFEDFVRVLGDVDLLLLLEVYAAGESPINGADGRALMRAIRVTGKTEPVFVETKENLYEVLPNVLEDGDILVTMGAGDVGRLPSILAAHYQSSGGAA